MTSYLTPWCWDNVNLLTSSPETHQRLPSPTPYPTWPMGTWSLLASSSISSGQRMPRPVWKKHKPTTPLASTPSNSGCLSSIMLQPQWRWDNNHSSRTRSNLSSSSWTTIPPRSGSSRGQRSHPKGKPLDDFNAATWLTILGGSTPTGSPPPTMLLPIIPHNSITTIIHALISSVLHRASASVAL